LTGEFNRTSDRRIGRIDRGGHAVSFVHAFMLIGIDIWRASTMPSASMSPTR